MPTDRSLPRFKKSKCQNKIAMRAFLAAICCLAGVRADGLTNASALPSFIHPCSASDPNLNSCIERSITIAGPTFVQGIPELGIATLDPVQLGTVLVDNPSLKIKFTETVVTGLSGFKVNSFKMRADAGKATFDFTAPNVTLKAHYDMDGQVLILPIRGNGQAKIKITNLNIIIKYDYETREGHWVVTGYKDHYKMDRAQFKFTNLFGGNKQLGDTIHRVINEHWEPVIRDFAGVSFEHIIRACVDESKKLFAAAPASQLLLP